MTINSTASPPIKVLLADDHTLFRKGLAKVLASYGGLEVVGETTNDQKAIELTQQKKPDVVVMQVQIPFERARHSLEQMRTVSPPPKVVICTMFEDPSYLRRFLELGVQAYLVKSVSEEELVGAIRAAVFDPNGKNVVVGMPQEMIERAQKGSEGVLRGCANRRVANVPKG